MTTPDAPVYAVARDTLTPELTAATLDRAVVAMPDVAIVDVSGSGAVACLQGLLTNDLETPGAGALVYGAVLTPKGMIVCDLWAERDRSSVRLTVPGQGVGALLAIFTRSLPPRLARAAERSSEQAVIQVVGPQAANVTAAAGVAVPPEGHWTSALVADSACTVARAHGGAPFAVQIVAPRARAEAVIGALTAAGAVRGGASALELARIVAGWPRLGAEVDDRTLPQEVRYDEIGGVSYTKGCYTGQETVARIHFRGHANRLLRGLTWADEPDLTRPEVTQDERPRGRVTSLVWVPTLDRYLGLGVLRREVDLARPVTALGVPAQVTPLPFPLD